MISHALTFAGSRELAIFAAVPCPQPAVKPGSPIRHASLHFNP